MNLSHVSDDVLMHGFATLVAQDRRTTAALLAHIAEIDARHLYLKFGHESMRAWCVATLHLSEDAAAKRLQVARLARRLPALFPAIADGRLHMGAVRVLAVHLNAENVDDLIAAASHLSVAQVEVMLAHRYPQAELLRLDDGVSPQVVVPQQANVVEHATWHAQPVPKTRTKITPLSAERYRFEISLAAATHDKLRRAQALLGHAVPSGNVEQVIDRALDALLSKLEKRKFAVTERPAEPRKTVNVRAIPAHVRRAVYERDAGRCAWVDERGRCGSTSRLEFDHVRPVARGGTSTVENLRLLCGPHNRYAAERAFGTEFMDGKRSAPRHRA
jgi:hypothetical protein